MLRCRGCPPATRSRKRCAPSSSVRARVEHREQAELVIITGMSGSGKASALKAFEDLGYYCVDNLPVELIPRFAELALQSGEILAHRAGGGRARGIATGKPARHTEVRQADDSHAGDFSGGQRRVLPPPVQRDSPSPSARDRRPGSRLAHGRTTASAGDPRDRRPGDRHVEVQRARTARRT